MVCFGFITHNSSLQIQDNASADGCILKIKSDVSLAKLHNFVGACKLSI